MSFISAPDTQNKSSYSSAATVLNLLLWLPWKRGEIDSDGNRYSCGRFKIWKSSVVRINAAEELSRIPCEPK